MRNFRSPLRGFRNRGMTRRGGGGVTVPAQTAFFGAATPASAGGFQPFNSLGIPQELASVTGSGLTRTWSISGGKLIANGTPDVDDGKTLTVTTVDGDSAEITIDASTYNGETVATYVEFRTLVLNTARFTSKSHVVRCTDFTADATSTFNGWQGGTGAAFTAERLDVRPPIFTCPAGVTINIAGSNATTTGNLTMTGIHFFGQQATNSWGAFDPAYGLKITLNILTCSNVTVSRCRFYSDYDAASSGYLADQSIVGIAFGSSSTGCTVTDCEIDHIYQPFQVRGTSNTVTKCDIHDYHMDGLNILGGSGITISFNRFYNAVGCLSMIHQDGVQFTGATTNASIIGNVFFATISGMRPGMDPPSNITVASSTTLTASQLSRGVLVTTTGQTITLPDPALYPGEDVVIGCQTNGHTGTVAATDPAHSDVLPLAIGFFQTPSLVCALKSDGVKWVPRDRGIRAGIQRRPAANLQLTEATHLNRIHRFSTGGGQITATLPVSPATNGSRTSNRYCIEADEATGSVRIVSGDATPMERYGVSVTEWVIEGFQEAAIVYLSSGVWQIEDAGVGNQGIFSNAYSHVGPFDFSGNLLYVMQTWAIRVEGSGAQIPDPWLINYNSVIAPVFAPLSGEVRTFPNRGGLIFGTEGTIELRGSRSRAVGNLTYGRFTDALGGGVNQDGTELLYAIGDSGDPTKMLTGFVGPTFTPSSVAEAIAAAEPVTFANPTGAHAIVDFTNRRLRTDLPALALSVPSHTAGGVLEIVCSYVPLIGTGNITIWNVTTNSSHQVIAIGSFTVSGRRLTVTPTAMTAGQTYAIRADGTALTGRYGNAFSAITDDSVSFVPV